MTRILALHGVGSSADILKDQLAVVLNQLGPGYEVHYLDGSVQRPRGPGMPLLKLLIARMVLQTDESIGMAAYYPGPFYSYTTGYTPSEMREAFEDIDAAIEDYGPFCGVVGFSQGAALAAAYLLDWQRVRQDEALPFEFAIFFSSVAAFSGVDAVGLGTVNDLLKNKLSDIKDFPNYHDQGLDEMEKVFVDYLSLTFLVAKKIGAVLPEHDIEFFKHEDAEMIPRILHPALHKLRLKIPTVHILGVNDLPSMTEQSKLVHGLCDESTARLIYHKGGHSVPSRRPEATAVAKQIEWAMAEGASRRELRKAFAKVTTMEVL
ncbi:inducible nitrate reductase 2 [Nemania sp. FL0916]|nr:inducible nitrate reductase 2 [Nemania sp. FL0916]